MSMKLNEKNNLSEPQPSTCMNFSSFAGLCNSKIGSQTQLHVVAP